MKKVLPAIAYFVCIVLTGLMLFGCGDPADIFRTGLSATAGLIIIVSMIVVLIVVFMARLRRE